MILIREEFSGDSGRPTTRPSKSGGSERMHSQEPCSVSADLYERSDDLFSLSDDLYGRSDDLYTCSAIPFLFPDNLYTLSDVPYTLSDNLYTRLANLYRRSADLYTRSDDLFTCSDVLYTRLAVRFSLSADPFAPPATRPTHSAEANSRLAESFFPSIETQSSSGRVLLFRLWTSLRSQEGRKPGSSRPLFLMMKTRMTIKTQFTWLRR